MVVLVVEDDGLISLMACEELERADYEVISSCNADEAINILESRNDVGVVFTDIEMPGSIDGLRLAAAVRDRWPPVHIIITTGRRRPRDELLPEGSTFLAKPYGGSDLLEIVKSFG